MRVLIIGGTGFIGQHVVRQIVGQDHEVTIFHRGTTKAGFPAAVCEIVDPDSTLPIARFPEELFHAVPDVVIHTMAMGLTDAKAVVAAFGGKAKRLVVLSSGDVYRAYGRFIGIEPGPIEEGLLSEDAPLRTALFPYRKQAPSVEALQYWYEKILVEQTVLSSKTPPATVLRLPKVYGPGGNADLGTVYRFRHHPNWRWTHGYVENVAAAIVLAATNPAASGRVYNVGEEYTPTVTERLAWMPALKIEPDIDCANNFAQNIAYDTTRIRRELAFEEKISEQEAMLKTLQSVDKI
jgi:nucleoside-diphosphate-sugar epimerase